MSSPVTPKLRAPKTPNYQFPSPLDTEFVADGADAFRTIVSDIDAKIKNALSTAVTGMVTTAAGLSTDLTWRIAHELNVNNPAAGIQTVWQWVTTKVGALEQASARNDTAHVNIMGALAARNANAWTYTGILPSGLPPWGSFPFRLPSPGCVMGCGDVNQSGWAFCSYGVHYDSWIGYIVNSLTTPMPGPFAFRINIVGPLENQGSAGWSKMHPTVQLQVPNAAGGVTTMNAPQGTSIGPNGEMLWTPPTPPVVYCHSKYPVPGMPIKDMI